MPPQDDQIEQKVLSALNERTLVDGAAVDTAPIAHEVGITAEELEAALVGLEQKGWIRRVPGGTATMTAEGHARQI